MDIWRWYGIRVGLGVTKLETCLGLSSVSIEQVVPAIELPRAQSTVHPPQATGELTSLVSMTEELTPL